MGGLGEDGHVLSYDQKTLKEEDKLLEEDTAAEEGIKDEDFQATRDKLRQLRRLLAEIHSSQQKERRRLIIHANTNKHSHSRMVLSSLMETCLFMAVTGFQVSGNRRCRPQLFSDTAHVCAPLSHWLPACVAFHRRCCL